ncbi:MAG: 5'-methylthioadenosine/adenosylhomocysteine nucleosidase [Firmicutes bacterium]|nr:5'-methylthioadenosine/adenosylhomocysteine nucleosidase [Bacillota bacterium]
MVMRQIKRIGILGAMASEMEAIKASIEEPCTEEISGVRFVRGRIHGIEVVAATCGIGKVFAALCAQTMILTYQPDLVINVGVAGSLSPKLNIGDIAVADRVVQHDMDTTAIGDPAGLLSGLDMVYLPCSTEVVQMMEACADALGYHHETGVVATGDVFMTDSQKKRQVADTFGAICCEMEGGSIGQVCYVNGTDFCILRAISDNGDENAHDDYHLSLDMAADRATQVMDRFLANLAVGQKVFQG